MSLNLRISDPLKQNPNAIHRINSRLFELDYPCNNNDCAPIVGNFPAGRYFFEAWGASGGDAIINGKKNSEYQGGKGAFVSGELTLFAKTVLFLNIGNTGQDADESDEKEGTYGGGGNGSYYGGSGGGSTDIRLQFSRWGDFESLKSRILVAGGGGGGNKWCSYIKGGDAGALKGYNGTQRICEDGTIHGSIENSQGAFQNRGGFGGKIISPGPLLYVEASNGQFGFGGDAKSAPHPEWIVGGGGGYFGGGGGSTINRVSGSGAGGSSFVSGYPGCRAINENSVDFDHYTMSDKPLHYSGLLFRDVTMLDGQQPFESLNSTEEIGHIGKGALRIRILEYFPTAFFSPKKKETVKIARKVKLLILHIFHIN